MVVNVLLQIYNNDTKIITDWLVVCFCMETMSILYLQERTILRIGTSVNMTNWSNENAVVYNFDTFVIAL